MVLWQILRGHRSAFLNRQVFDFEGQNMTFTVNVLLTCILYCVAGPDCD